MHGILDLAHVTGPCIGEQLAAQVGSDQRRRVAILPGKTAKEMFGKQEDIGAAIPQRRHLDQGDLQTEQQILAERAIFDQGMQVRVGRRHNPHVGLDRRFGAEGPVLPVLQEPQQRHLGAAIEGIDFVEQQGASLGERNQALLRRTCIRVSAAAVAEKLILDQRVGQCTAVHRDKGPFPAWAQIVQGTRNQLLAGTRFAADQDRHVAHRIASDESQDPAKCRGRPDDAKIGKGRFLNQVGIPICRRSRHNK